MDILQENISASTIIVGLFKSFAMHNTMPHSLSTSTFRNQTGIQFHRKQLLFRSSHIASSTMRYHSYSRLNHHSCRQAIQWWSLSLNRYQCCQTRCWCKYQRQFGSRRSSSRCQYHSIRIGSSLERVRKELGWGEGCTYIVRWGMSPWWQSKFRQWRPFRL
ncbi:hypothetical protein BT63DRAFT_37580 [Microthyrium microscopicum]|uniref:Uncharacterized protein n=1 Tax=Microthyrium microscopicum TaxID=703497 RepID=A0A6A6UWJ0_9PEZI|nr:hypothetical protein BT63DRAFT_37580 [Microthyrium microscopicum]